MDTTQARAICPLQSSHYTVRQKGKQTWGGGDCLHACVRACAQVFMYVCLGRYVLIVVNRPHPLEDGDKSFCASVPSHLPTLDLPRGGRNLRPKHFQTMTLILYELVSVKPSPQCSPAHHSLFPKLGVQSHTGVSEDGRGVYKDGVCKVFVGHASAWGCPSDKGAEVRAGICLIVCMCVLVVCDSVHTRAYPGCM